MRLIIFTVLVFPFVAIAQDPSAAEPVIPFVDKLTGWLNSAIGSSVAIGLVLEFVFRSKKTEKALSVAHMVGRAFKELGELFEKFGDFLDQVLPQRTITEEENK